MSPQNLASFGRPSGLPSVLALPGSYLDAISLRPGTVLPLARVLVMTGLPGYLGKLVLTGNPAWGQRGGSIRSDGLESCEIAGSQAGREQREQWGCGASGTLGRELGLSSLLSIWPACRGLRGAARLG